MQDKEAEHAFCTDNDDGEQDNDNIEKVVSNIVGLGSFLHKKEFGNFFSKGIVLGKSRSRISSDINAKKLF